MSYTILSFLYIHDAAKPLDTHIGIVNYQCHQLGIKENTKECLTKNQTRKACSNFRKITTVGI